MICPYFANTAQTSISAFGYDENENETCCKNVTATIVTPHECKQQECGAWQNGKCTKK